MKKVALVVVMVLAMAGVACAGVQARDALIAYVGTDAFTTLTSGERQACVEWISEGGVMSAECRKAVMKLVSVAPRAVTVEQRQALVLAAADNSTSDTATTTTDAPVIVEKKDDKTSAVIIGGLVGLLAGLVIANNRHHSSAPSRPGPPEAFRAPKRRPVPGPGGKLRTPPRVPAGKGPKRPPSLPSRAPKARIPRPPRR